MRIFCNVSTFSDRGVNLLNTLPHPPRQKQAGHHSCRGGQQRSPEGISGLRHFRRRKVYRHGVENRFRTAHQQRGDDAYAGICTVLLVNIQQQPGSGAGGKKAAVRGIRPARLVALSDRALRTAGVVEGAYRPVARNPHRLGAENRLAKRVAPQLAGGRPP